MSRSQLANYLAFATTLIAAVTLTSCSYGPSRLEPPHIDPADSGRQAMEMYDTNGDGRVAGEELENAPSLKSALSRLDTDGDQAVSADEVAARVKVWQNSQLAVLPLTINVTLDGRPLAGATVTFEPEPFLGDYIAMATATTDEFGGSSPSVPKELRPDPERTPSGIQLGLYRVKVSKVVNGQERIPSKYNEETILGQEISPDVKEMASLRLNIKLSTKP